MNKFIGMGRFTGDPKVTYSQDGKARAEFTLALDRMKEGADFPRFIAWDKQAELAEKYCRKGMKILVEGKIHTGSYDNSEGKKVYTTDVYVDRFEFVEKKGSVPEEGVGQNTEDGFMKIPDGLDEELPFN